MADIFVTDARLATASQHLLTAAAPVPGAVWAVDAVGSAEVAAAIGDAQDVLERVMVGLAVTAKDAAADADAIAAGLGEADRRLGAAGAGAAGTAGAAG